MVEKLLSAQEIAALNLPGVPGTKAAVHAMAKREGWYFEEVTGIGGTKRLYRVPTRHVRGGDVDVPISAGALAGAIAPSGRADPALLVAAIRAFEEFAGPRGLQITPDRKAAVIALLYDYLAKGAQQDDVDAFLRVVG